MQETQISPELIKELLKNPLIVTRELNNRSLYHFIKTLWPVYSAQPFSPNWHIEYICKELEKVAEQVSKRLPRVNDLIINVPPGSTKTACVSIFFPIWCWTKWHWMLIITMSYSDKLSLESAEYCRDILRSPQFQELYPDIIIKEDKDVKSNFKVAKRVNGAGGPHRTSKLLTGGGRISTSVTGTIMGFHADILIVDDPLNPVQAASDIELTNANHFMEQTLPSRKRDKEITPTILIQQRLHQDDPSGHWLAKQEENVKHICLPGEIRNFRHKVNPPELVNNYVDDLLDTKRISWKVLKDLESKLGQYGYAGQIGQDPTPPGGGMFKVDRLVMVNSLPNPREVMHTIRAWDKAGTAGGGDYTVGVKMSKLLGNRWIVEDVVRGRWASQERERIIRAVAEADGVNVDVWMEQEPGPIWEEELVQMADGLRKKLKDIVKGDFVINGNGDSTEVIETYIQDDLDTLRITTNSGRVIYASYEHPFLTPNGWVNAIDLEVEDILALKTNIKTTKNDNLLIEECRLLGYMIGDGCCTWTKNKEVTCNASIVSSDEIEGLDIVRCADAMGFGVWIGGSKGWTYYLSTGARDWLKNRGLAGKNTFNKEVPDWLQTASNECIANFLGAYLACDGSVGFTKDHPSIEYYSTNLELMKVTQSLLLRFGIYTMLRTRNYNPEFQKSRHLQYRLVMRRGDGSMGRFAKYIPVYGVKNLKLQNFKHTVFDQSYLTDPIVSIEKSGKLPCRCLTVADGESFLVNDIVVHNSSGKDSAEGTIRNLAGFRAFAEHASGDKAFRADPFSVQVNNGAVMLLNGLWNREYIEELRFFPFSTHKDQTDSSSLCFKQLVGKKIARRIT